MTTPLEQAIDHWIANSKAPLNEVKLGPKYCALCNLYYPSCAKCPVKQYTGKRGCEGTPLYDAEDAHAENHEGRFRVHAQREVTFLKSLRPSPAPITTPPN